MHEFCVKNVVAIYLELVRALAASTLDFSVNFCTGLIS